MQALNIDINSKQFKCDPFPVLKALREIGPIVRTKLPMIGETWVTTTYEATNAILRDKDTFVNDPRNAGRKTYAGMQWWMPKSLQAMTSNMLGRDEPDHRRLRSLTESAFLKRSIDDMRPRIAKLVDQQLDLMEKQAIMHGMVDFIDHFSRPLPLAVICELLGLPEEDRTKFTRWCNFTSVSGVWGFIRALGGIGKMQRYLKHQFELCRKQSRPGMISALVAAEQEGDRLSEEELLASAIVLLIAGHETTVHLLNGGVLTLLQRSWEIADLKDDWSICEPAVDEILRYFTPVQMTKPRYAKRDVILYGQQIKRGEFFMPLLAAANSDPAKFYDPERFDVRRSPNQHLAFGAGIHVCLGLKLAKAEAEIAFERLFTRFPTMQISIPESRLDWSERIGMRALSSLPINLSGASGTVQSPHRQSLAPQ